MGGGVGAGAGGGLRQVNNKSLHAAGGNGYMGAEASERTNWGISERVALV